MSSARRPEDFIANDDEAEQRAFELTRRLSEVEAKAARQWAALEARTDVALVREYEQWQAAGGGHSPRQGRDRQSRW
jgi:hypothetical protein